MLEKINLILESRPVSKDNEKIFSRHGRPFTSKRFKNYDKIIKHQAQLQMQFGEHKMFTIPVKVTIRFFFKNDSRLDLHNAPKSICDALNGIVWKDDRLIHESRLILGYDNRERAEVTVEAAYFYPDMMIASMGKINSREGGFILGPGTPKGIATKLKKAIKASGQHWSVNLLK